MSDADPQPVEQAESPTRDFALMLAVGALGAVLGLGAALGLERLATDYGAGSTAVVATKGVIRPDDAARALAALEAPDPDPANGGWSAAVVGRQPAWRANAAPYDGPAAAPKLALVLIDDGRDASAALAALRAGFPVTMAFSAGADGLRARAAAARRLGRETLMVLPFERADGGNSGPNAIATRFHSREIARRVRWTMAQIDAPVGVVSRYGAAVSRDAATMRIVMNSLGEDGFLFLDSLAHPESLAAATARRAGTPASERTVEIEEADDAGAMRVKLARAERHARDWGHAILLAPARAEVVETLEAWRAARKDDVALAPLSAVVAGLRAGAG